MFAIDAQAGTKKWSLDPGIPPEAERVACCSSINRGVALFGDHVFVGTMDARLFTLHRDTGHVEWEAEAVDWRQGYSIMGAPLVVKDMVLTGIAGGEFGVRGFVKAFDAGSGDLRWTTYTIPGTVEPGNETWVRIRARHAAWLRAGTRRGTGEGHPVLTSTPTTCRQWMRILLNCN